MYIKIIKPINDETRESYWFYLLDNLSFVFVEYLIEQKKTKKSWKTIQRWSIYMPSESNITEPLLTPEIRNLAIKEAISLIKIKTWKEYKNN